MLNTPDYDAMVTEYGDPYPVLAEITEATAQPPPEIAEAHDEQERAA